MMRKKRQPKLWEELPVGLKYKLVVVYCAIAAVLLYNAITIPR